MTSLANLTQISGESLITEFFRQSEGRWRSERRYYTLPEGNTQEMVSLIEIQFLAQGHDALEELAQRHELPAEQVLVCGAKVGSTIFGVRGEILYRDRGFATPKPVTAQFQFTNPHTLCLRTEYSGSVFEEELKLVGQKYRTRQTIISRAGEQQMIGQYLEKRLD